MTQYKENLVIYEASDFFSRLRGLLFRPELTETEALHITPCRDVHSIGMRYDLDVVFLSVAGEVIKIKKLKPNRWCISASANSVLEFKAGIAERHGFSVGAMTGKFKTTTIRQRHVYKKIR